MRSVARLDVVVVVRQGNGAVNWFRGSGFGAPVEEGVNLELMNSGRRRGHGANAPEPARFGKRNSAELSGQGLMATRWAWLNKLEQSGA